MASRARLQLPVRGTAEQLALSGFLLLLVAGLLATGRASLALGVALLPAGTLLLNRTRTVIVWVLFPLLVATLALGQWFSKFAVGPVYVLDAGLLVVGILVLPALLAAASRNPAATTAVLLYLGLTIGEVLAAGPSRVVLRQSVLGLYALWVFLGMAITRTGLLDAFMRLTFWGAAAATVIYGLALLHVVSIIPIIPVAHSLYAGYGLLLVPLAPAILRSRRWTNALILAEIVVVGLGLVRSVWLALPVAVILALLASGRVAVAGRHVLRLLALAGIALLIGTIALPQSIAGIGTEASSIVTFDSGATKSDNNAKWRLNNWRYGLRTISSHPFTGIGFGQSEVPVSVCGTACDTPDAHGDATVLPGSDLHNSILAIPLRFGVLGVVVLVMLEVAAFRRIRRYGCTSATLAWAYGCHVFTFVTALTAVVLEGPYMGIFFWLTLGLVLGFPADGEA